MKSQLQRGLLLAAIVTTSFVAVNTASAASACKGLEQSACQTATSCGWVNSYTRKDGREVKAFCRTSSKGTKKSVSGSAQKAASKEVAAKTN